MSNNVGTKMYGNVLRMFYSFGRALIDFCLLIDRLFTLSLLCTVTFARCITISTVSLQEPQSTVSRIALFSSSKELEKTYDKVIDFQNIFLTK